MAKFSLIILLLLSSHSALTMDERASEQDQVALESFESCVLKLRWAVIDYLRSFSRDPRRKAEYANNVELWLSDCKAKLTALTGAELKTKVIWKNSLEQTEKDFRRIKRKDA